MSRYKKPLALALLDGSAAKNPQRYRDRSPGPTFDGQPRMPRDLPEAAKKVWRRIVPTLPPSLLAAADTINLAAACRWLVAFDYWMTRVESSGVPDAETIRDLRAAKLAWEQFSAIAINYGMSPLARQRLAGPRQQQTQDPLLSMFNSSKNGKDDSA